MADEVNRRGPAILQRLQADGFYLFLDAVTGRELLRVKFPPGVTTAEILMFVEHLKKLAGEMKNGPS